MAVVEQRLIERLKASADVSAIVGTRVYGGHADQGDDRPYLVLTKISDVTLNTLSGPNSLKDCESRIQVDCYAPSYAVVKTLAEAVRESLNGWSDESVKVESCLLDSEQDDLSEPTDESARPIQRVTMDFIVWYQDE